MSDHDQIAIKIDGVSKDFRLPHQRVDSLKDNFVNLFRSSSSEAEMQHALKDISFEVKKGEFFGIVGRNGSGKSTLLKIIANIYRPTAGDVKVNGRLVPFIELGVGFNPDLTGRENIYLNGALMGFSKKEIDVKYDAIVNFAELERFMDQKLKNYSSGMQVRLAFSVATILADSDILLIDEVLAVGDADFQRKCFNYFRQLKKMKKTVIFVSHDMEAVREYCDSCILIDDSKTLYQGSPEVAAEKYTKLFNTSKSEEATTTPGKSNDDRWGDGSAKVEQVHVTKKGEDVIVDVKVEFAVRMIDPIVGFLIKDAAGQTVCGTNSRIIRKKFGTCEKGQSINMTWTIPNIFSSNTYTVEVAVSHRDGVTQADWWHNAAEFTNRNEYSTPHIVSPSIVLNVTTD